MKVLFFEYDDRFIFGLPLGFRDAGHKILVSGKLTEDKIYRLIRTFKPGLAVLLGWTSLHTDVNIYTICEACKSYNVPIIYWATEDPTFTEVFSIPLIKKLNPAYVFTIAPSKVAIYESLGYPAKHLPFGYQPSICQPSACCNWCSKNIAVVANAYPNVLYSDPTHYRNKSLSILIKPILEQCIPIDFWGNHWDQMQPYIGIPIHSKYIHGYLHYLQAPSVYNCSNITMGLQNYKDDVITMRTYEILGSRGFLITSYNDALCTLFQHERDMIIASTPEETLEYVRYYMAHPEMVESIKNNGLETVSQHTYGYRAASIAETLRRYGII